MKQFRSLVLVAGLLLAILPVSNLIPLPSLVVAPYRAGVAVSVDRLVPNTSAARNTATAEPESAMTRPAPRLVL